MKNSLLLILVLFTSVSMFSQKEALEFPESGFKAIFAKVPTIEKNEIETQIGKAKITQYLSEGSDFMLMLSESQYPDNLLKTEVETVYKGMINGATNAVVENISKQMKTEYKSTLSEDFKFDDKYPGKKFEGILDEVNLKGMTFIKGFQMYQIIIIGNTNAVAVNEFLNSFTLIESK